MTPSAEDGRRLVHDFVDETFGDLDANPDFVAMLRSAVPEMPADPGPEQVDAWAELSALVRDADFKASVRRMAEHQAAERAEGDRTGLHHEVTELVLERVRRARTDGVEPGSPEARAVLVELIAGYTATFGHPDSAAYRRKLLTRLEVANDPRTERYFALLSTINGGPVPPSLAPVFDWFIQALRHHPVP
ncbi:TipAS antibiotic-recognition domain-containing protein [Sphaerisporangium corydalis]|uniref:TipAS antibiotic-recognition domain-containing protein n=1 Tax=Sphaerisporangium corydalis TaxID=1441875 RepID=A0ABV9ETP1_9ACTN|nr:TipAS antibiotic-recognition domain-containing protein [Sphaerisporangium corydalis]